MRLVGQYCDGPSLEEAEKLRREVMALVGSIKLRGITPLIERLEARILSMASVTGLTNGASVQALEAQGLDVEGDVSDVGEEEDSPRLVGAGACVGGASGSPVGAPRMASSPASSSPAFSGVPLEPMTTVSGCIDMGGWWWGVGKCKGQGAIDKRGFVVHVISPVSSRYMKP